MFSIHRNTPSIDPDQKGEQPSTCDGTFTFEDVKFRYPSRPDVPLFEGLTLSIQKGKTTALVGESGSGKSTIMALLQRFYDVERGTIKLDGVDLRQLDQRWLRSNIGLVAQEPVLFATTIRKNILFGKPDASDQDVEDAAKAANAHDFIMKFDDGYDTYVGEKGSQISGGQKQRIAIARALLHRPKILLLDEATSALDNQSQKEVQGTIDKIMADESRQLTCVVIAHRLSTIYNADAICVFEHGKKVQEGTHTQLAAESDGLYARLIADQEKLFAGAEAAGGGGKKSAADHVVSEVVATDTTGVAPKEDKKDEEEKEKCYTTADILKETGKSGKPLMGLGLLAAVAAGCALPLWALFFADVTKAFYCCPPWDPNLMLNLVDNTTGALNLVDGKITGTATIDGVVFERAVSPQEYQIMTTNAAKGLMVYGLEEPTLYGVFADFDSCTSMQTDKINFWAFMFLVLGAVLGISEYFKAFAWGAMACTVTMNLRKKYFKGVIYKEIGFFDETEHTSGNLTSRLAADTQLVSGALGPSIGAALQSMATLILGMILAFTGGWQLALALLGFMPLMTISAKIQNDLIFGLSGKEQDGLGAANQVASESIQGIRTVRSFGMENEVLELYESLCTDKENDGNRHIKTAVVSGIATGLSQFLMFALYWVAFLYGGYLIKHAGYSGSDVMQTFMAIMMAAFGIAMANMAVPDVGKSAAAAEGIFSTLQRMSLIDASETGKQDREFDGTVHFEGVNFAYPSRVDRPILKNVNLLIEKGKTTALVGPSGSGKSTIVSLIQRFYDPTKGSVQTSSGVKLSDMDVKWWRTQIGVVGQEPVLFKGSILDNISRGKPGCSRAEVEDAAKRAYAHGFIMKSCPDGYDTDVGERGSVLSGGQKQRIAIARALIRHPKILLLDEATSALDNQSEKEVQEAIDNIIATEQMTCVVIAHRLNTIVGADKIVVFEQGCIVQTGTHQSLLAEEGLYAELAAR